jgi:hypothetical protein
MHIEPPDSINHEVSYRPRGKESTEVRKTQNKVAPFINSLVMLSLRVFTNIYSLPIDKDGRASRNISISRYSFHVFLCVYPSVISSISGMSFHFPFPYFMKLVSYEYCTYYERNLIGSIVKFSF